jgi:hypothetical protein
MKPGLYHDLSMKEYLEAPGLSSSGAKRLARSAAHYRDYIDNPKPSTPDQEEGTVLHSLLFDPKNFDDGSAYHCRPDTYTAKGGEIKPWHGASSWCKGWLKLHTDLPVMTDADLITIHAMHRAIRQHPAAKLALSCSMQAEVSAFCIDPVSKMKMKARFDCIAGNTLVDAKKCIDASREGFKRRIAQFGYDLQAAFHLQVAQILELDIHHFVFIAVEDEPPHAVGVYELSQKALQTAHLRMRSLLDRYAECVEQSKWPAYSSNIEILDLPGWYVNMANNELLLEDQPPVPALEV